MSDPTMQQRWVNDGDPEKIKRLEAMGYKQALDAKGWPKQRFTNRAETETATLYEIPMITRNLGGWLEMIGKNRSPAILARIMRLNPTIQEGARPRGWNPAPTLKARKLIYDCMGKGEFIKIYGRKGWERAVEEGDVVHDGKRAYVGGSVKREFLLHAGKGDRSMETFRSMRRKSK